jgi:hypothetical protein
MGPNSSTSSSREARLFLRDAVLFLLLQIVVLTGLWQGVRYFQGIHSFDNGTTESAWRLIPRSESFDVVMLGSSHARNFSRDGNHAEVEKILDAKILNISRGAGGIVPNAINIAEFYNRGNHATDLVYFIDAWCLFSRAWNEEMAFAKIEPLSLHYLSALLRFGINPHIVVEYLSYKFSIEWLQESPDPVSPCLKKLSRADPEAVKKRLKALYPDGMNMIVFRQYLLYLDDIVEMARAHGTKHVFLITPPTLLRNDPGEALLKKYLAQHFQSDRSNSGLVITKDLSAALADPGLFQDHDHPNSEGVAVFSREFLKPLLRAAR